MNEELVVKGVDVDLLVNCSYVKVTSMLEGIEFFDAEFFGFTTQRAEITVPQQWKTLECSWEALEDAGYGPSFNATKEDYV